MLLAALLCTAASGGCAASPGDRLDGDAVAALTGRAPRVLLLVFRPEDCLACATDMPQLLAFRRRTPERVAILLTRPPSRSEAQVFARYRIPVDGILRRGTLAPARGGSAYLYVAGELAASGPLRRAAIQSTVSAELAR